MDWSKAKNIIIAALIAANIFIGFNYWQSLKDAKDARERSASYTASYLAGLGVTAECDLSAEEDKLPVLFVEIEPSEGEETLLKDGRELVLIGAEGQKAVPSGYGDNKGRVISASAASRRLVSLFGEDELKGLVIKGAELVYLVARTDLSGLGGQDTAVPAWRFDTSLGVRYVEAFAN